MYYIAGQRVKMRDCPAPIGTCGHPAKVFIAVREITKNIMKNMAVFESTP